jgi:hypothetical protein
MIQNKGKHKFLSVLEDVNGEPEFRVKLMRSNTESVLNASLASIKKQVVGTLECADCRRMRLRGCTCVLYPIPIAEIPKRNVGLSGGCSKLRSVGRS